MGYQRRYRDQLSKRPDNAFVDRAKRQASSSRPITNCRQMLEAQPNVPNLPLNPVASYCTSKKQWRMICSMPPVTDFLEDDQLEDYIASPFMNSTNVRGAGTCRSDEICRDGIVHDNMPVAWCVSGNAFVTLANLAISKFHWINDTNRIHLNPSNISQTNRSRPVQTNLGYTYETKISEAFRISPSMWSYFVTPHSQWILWLTCFIIGGSPRSLVKVPRIDILPEPQYAPAGRKNDRCKDCSWLTSNFSQPDNKKLMVTVRVPTGGEAPILQCLDGFLPVEFYSTTNGPS